MSHVLVTVYKIFEHLDKYFSTQQKGSKRQLITGIMACTWVQQSNNEDCYILREL